MVGNSKANSNILIFVHRGQSHYFEKNIKREKYVKHYKWPPENYNGYYITDLRIGQKAQHIAEFLYYSLTSSGDKK